MRTYSFDHFKADKPEPSTTNPGGAEQTPPAEQAKPQADTGLHYGRAHAQTAELYRKHREERERSKQMRVSESPAESTDAEAPVAQRAAAPQESTVVQEKADMGKAQDATPDETRLEGLKGLAQQAVSRVMEAAKEAAKGRPLTGAKKLAGDAFSGVRRVAREVSARTGRTPQEAPDKQEPKREEPKQGVKKKKGPGKKR
ncbi:hypothetical protein NR798_44405 [Archangium gephyra]|uniref:hypothetical protein n=1 Tax=Archangium gephyra TaxID=48 RepID=UPI0035D4DC25